MKVTKEGVVETRPLLLFVGFTPALMEVIYVKGSTIIKTVGTYVLIGAASAAGAALWTNVIEDRCRRFTAGIRSPKSEKVTDFKKAKRRMSRN